jgi:hypothetical protein
MPSNFYVTQSRITASAHPYCETSSDYFVSEREFVSFAFHQMPHRIRAFLNVTVFNFIALNLNSVNQLISVMVKCGVLFEVRTAFLNTVLDWASRSKAFITVWNVHSLPAPWLSHVGHCIWRIHLFMGCNWEWQRRGMGACEEGGGGVTQSGVLFQRDDFCRGGTYHCRGKE